MERYIAFDCETGGLSTNCSLLTAYFVILEADLTTVVGELDLKIKPNVGEQYVVSAEALGINKINLVEHEKTAITLNQAKTEFYNFLTKNNMDDKIKYIPVGHNVSFDIGFLKEKLLTAGNWNKLVSYRQMDTGVVGQFLKMTGNMHKDVSGSLGSMCEYFGVPLTDAHNARADTIATVKVLRKMKKIMEKQ